MLDERKRAYEVEDFDTKLDILKFSASVHSRIKRDVSSDFILARLSDKDKEGIIEMTCNAYFAKRVLLGLLNAERLTPDERKIIKIIADATFDAFMTRCYMTASLNRNVQKNYLLQILAGKNEETLDDEETTQNKENKFIEKLKLQLKPEKESKEK